MQELPFLIRWGNVIGPLLMVGGAVAPLLVVAALWARARREAERRAQRDRGRLGVPSAFSEDEGPQTLVGVLEAESSADLLDGLATGAGATLSHPGTSARHDRVPKLALRVASHRLPIEGPIEVVLGSQQRNVATSGAAPIARVDWLQPGDEVVVQGTVVPDWSGARDGYREAVDAWRLEAPPDHDAVRVAWCETPRVRGLPTQRRVVLAAALAVTAGALAPLLLTSLGAYGSVYSKVDDAPNWTAQLGALSPLKRRDVLGRLAQALDDPALAPSPRREKSTRQLVTRVDDCALSAWFHGRHGRWSKAANAAEHCERWLHAGWYRWSAGDVAAASAAWANAPPPGEFDDDLHRTMIVAHVLAGDDDDAIRALRRWSRADDRVAAHCLQASLEREPKQLESSWAGATGDDRAACTILRWALRRRQKSDAAPEAVGVPRGVRYFTLGPLALGPDLLRGEWPEAFTVPTGEETFLVRAEPRETLTSALGYALLQAAYGVALPASLPPLSEIPARIRRVQEAEHSDRFAARKRELEPVLAPRVAKLVVAAELAMALHAWGDHAQARQVIGAATKHAAALSPTGEAMREAKVVYGPDDKWLGKVLRAIDLVRTVDLRLARSRGTPVTWPDEGEASWASPHELRCWRGLPDENRCEGLRRSSPIEALRDTHPHLGRRRLPLRVLLTDDGGREQLASYLRHGPSWWDLGESSLYWPPYDCDGDPTTCDEQYIRPDPPGGPLRTGVRDASTLIGADDVAEDAQAAADALRETVDADPATALIAAVAASL